MLTTLTFVPWAAFFFIVIILIVLDLGLLSKRNTIPSFRKSLFQSIGYFLIACLYGISINYFRGTQAGMEYFTAFFIEKALAIDNIFVINLIFSSLVIPKEYQHRVLLWGVLGAIVFRAIFIVLGTELIARFEWLLSVFAVILIVTGVKIMITVCSTNSNKSNGNNGLYVTISNLAHKYLNISPTFAGKKFLVKREGKIFATPLMVALILIETVDLIFAVDSIPAAFSVTQDIYVIYTSNIFAILGLRSLYFCLAGIIDKFYYLKHALGIILIFIGAKPLIAVFGAHISPVIALVSILLCLVLGIIFSILRPSTAIKQNNS